MNNTKWIYICIYVYLCDYKYIIDIPIVTKEESWIWKGVGEHRRSWRGKKVEMIWIQYVYRRFWKIYRNFKLKKNYSSWCGLRVTEVINASQSMCTTSSVTNLKNSEQHSMRSKVKNSFAGHKQTKKEVKTKDWVLAKFASSSTANSGYCILKRNKNNGCFESLVTS